jgi:hypothetical protein
MHGAEAHLRGIEPRPFGIDDAAFRHELVRFDRALGREHEPRGAVSDLRAVAGGDVAVLAIEERPQLREVVDRRVLANAVIGRIQLARLVVEGNELGIEVTRLCAASTLRWLAAANSSISRRVIWNRKARFSAVWPISNPTIGSVSPFIRPMTGAR